MDDRELRELTAAVVAHREWLTDAGVQLPAAAAELSALQLVRLMPGHSAADASEPEPWKAPRAIVEAVVTSLHSLCALRTRERVREIRTKKAEQAVQRAKDAEPEDRAQAKRALKPLQLTQDNSHVVALTPSLTQLRERLHTACRKLEKFKGDLRTRHKAFVYAGLVNFSSATRDFVLARWVSQRCEALDDDLEFLLAEVEGPVALGLTGHEGPADSKAWFRLRSQAKLSFKEAGAPASLRAQLFPEGPRPATAVDAKRRRQDKDRKEISRAKNEIILRDRGVSRRRAVEI